MGVKAARSVELASERLGIVAKLDLLEGEDSAIIINLGPAGDSLRFLLIGHHERLPTPSAVIV